MPISPPSIKYSWPSINVNCFLRLEFVSLNEINNIDNIAFLLSLYKDSNSHKKYWAFESSKLSELTTRNKVLYLHNSAL